MDHVLRLGRELNCGVPMIKTFLSLLLSSLVFADIHAACADGEYVCVDGPGSKYVDGVEVYRECWNYQFRRSCNEAAEVNYCAALEQTPACKLVNKVCVSADLSGTCLRWEQRFSCSEEIPPEENVELLDYSHTVSSSQQNSQCQSFIDNKECYVAAQRCIEPGETRVINGVAVYKDCWRYERDYACASSGVSNSCQTLEAASGCTAVGDPVCIKEDETGCAQWQKTYRCVNTGLIEGPDITPDGSPTLPGFDTLSCQNATAGMSCTLQSSSCTEVGGIKIIDGVEIETDCWEQTQEYRCIETVNENSCEALEKIAACKEQSSKCIDKVGLRCYAMEKEILCQTNEAIDPGPAQEITSDIVISGLTWSETCQPLDNNPDCSVLNTVCTEPGGTKEINGELITKDCWKYETTYVCGASNGPSSNCTSLEQNKKCVKVDSVCLFEDDVGKCLTYSHIYKCEEKESSTVTEVICRPAECLDGLCGEPVPADKDFAWVLSILEVAREGAVYGDFDGNQFFKGESDKCSKKVLGFSCCDTKVKSGSSNSDAFGKALTFAGDATVEAIKYVGSPYVYDVLSASEATSGLLTALYGNASSGIYNPSLSFYGFGMTLQGGTMYFTFDPTSFAVTVAFQIAMDFLQCEPSEQALMLKKGQNLCHYVGTYCSKGEKFGCFERSESYCCFNSRLARIIQEEGRKQTGKSWGSAKNPDCSGFTLEEFETLDFEAMDLSEFEAEIKAKAELNKEAAADRGQAHFNRLVNENLGGYVAPNQGTSGVVNPDFTGKPSLPPKKK